MESLTFKLRCQGCLLGGAVGDALGAPVEFLTEDEIRRQYGPGGIRDFALAYGHIGAITDDTQMTLFTAEGLLRALNRFADRGICHVPSVVHRAYLRWLRTQGEQARFPDVGLNDDGWLIGLRQLWARRAPGNTCLSALMNAQQLGQPAQNDSKGCGGVMRAAPVGLIANEASVFKLGCETAALTHGHPSGYLSAGMLAEVISGVVRGRNLPDSIQSAKQHLVAQPQHEEVLKAVEQAEKLAAIGSAPAKLLGQGWVAEEALSISLYCALAAPNFEEAVVLAVNHSGDSDSTGAITGNICGALYGLESIPPRWLEQIELRAEIASLADDIVAARQVEHQPDFERYPSW